MYYKIRGLDEINQSFNPMSESQEKDNKVILALLSFVVILSATAMFVL